MADTRLNEVLGRRREIRITVLGRRSGREISVRVWFVLEGRNLLLLLPVEGSGTEWYRNLQRDPTVTVSAGRVAFKARAALVTEPARVARVVEMFRGKYGAGEVRRWYSKFDACVEVALS